MYGRMWCGPRRGRRVLLSLVASVFALLLNVCANAQDRVAQPTGDTKDAVVAGAPTASGKESNKNDEINKLKATVADQQKLIEQLEQALADQKKLIEQALHIPSVAN